jgi:hypothetical protein
MKCLSVALQHLGLSTGGRYVLPLWPLVSFAVLFSVFLWVPVRSYFSLVRFDGSDLSFQRDDFLLLFRD